MPSTELRTVGVIGAGNIGIGVITDLVVHGITAVAVDISREVLERARTEVLNNLRVAPLFSKTLPRVSRSEALDRMVFATELKALASCDFIIENVTEDWQVKKALYLELDRVAPPHVCFGANTSC